MPPSRRQRAATEKATNNIPPAVTAAAPMRMVAPRGDRIVAKAVLVKQQRLMMAAAHLAIKRYVRLVRRAVAHEAIRAAAPQQPDDDDQDGDDDDLGNLGPDVDLNALDQSAAWPDILNSTILPELDKIIIGLGPQGRMTPSVVMAVDAWRASWMQARTQVLMGVPDQITRQIRDAIQASTSEHGPNPAHAANIVSDLLNPDADTWASRAMTIARTEVIGANNQGGLAAYTAVHQSLAPVGGQVYKTWLATDDAVTRPDHADIDGTEIQVDDTFDVGGQPMSGPGDESADGDETINCRCTLTYRVDDGTEESDDSDAAGEDSDALADDADVDDDSLTAAAVVNGEVPTGVAVLLMLAQTDAQRLTVDGGEPPDQMHVTVGYLADPAASYSDQVKAGILDGLAPLADMLPVQADAFATAHFNPEDDEREPCAVVLVQSGDLASIHDGVSDAIASVASTTFPIWIPHVTVAYNADPTVIPPGIVGGQLTFDRLILAWAGDQTTVTNPPADQAVTAAVEAPVTAPAPTTDAPPQPSDGTPSEAQAPANTPGAVQWSGPILPMDVPSSDGRMFMSSGMTIRQLPLTLEYQCEGTHGGEDAGKTVVVGRQLTASVVDNAITGTGDFLDPMINMDPAAAIEQVAAGIGFVSASVAVQVVSYMAPGPDGVMIPIDPMQFMGDPISIIQVAEQWEYLGATIVSQPAFGAARIEITDAITAPNLGAVVADAANPVGPTLTPDSITFPDGTTLKVGDQVNVIGAAGGDDSTPESGLIEAILPDTNQVTVAVEDADNPGQTNSITVDASVLTKVPDQADNVGYAASAASGAPGVGGPSGGADGIAAALVASGELDHVFEAEWFEPMPLDGPTALTVTADGRVYGHLAVFGSCHTGFADQCVAPPTSPSGYAYFHVGEVDTTRGPVPVGKLTVGGGHADLRQGWRGAVEHYDNAGAAVAVVRAHEDEHGIQVTGAVLPNASKDQVAALRRSPLSGDWRPIAGNRELVAALSVNVPGFPVPRAALAASGKPLALVAAGVVHETEDTTSGIVLPSGAEVSAADLVLIASVFADELDRRQSAISTASNVRALRRKLARDRLNLHAV